MEMSVAKQVIVPVSMLAAQMVGRSALYCKEIKTGVIEAPLTEMGAGRLVTAKCKDALSWALRWMTPTNEFETLLGQIVPNYDLESFSHPQRSFSHYVLNSIEHTIEQLVSDIVTGREWCIWSLEPLYHIYQKCSDERRLVDIPRSHSVDCVMICGEDFRVHEWDRLRRIYDVDYPFMQKQGDGKLIYPLEDKASL